MWMVQPDRRVASIRCPGAPNVLRSRRARPRARRIQYSRTVYRPVRGSRYAISRTSGARARGAPQSNSRQGRVEHEPCAAGGAPPRRHAAMPAKGYQISEWYNSGFSIYRYRALPPEVYNKKSRGYIKKSAPIGLRVRAFRLKPAPAPDRLCWDRLRIGLGSAYSDAIIDL